MRGRSPVRCISLVIIAAAAAGLTGPGPAAATVATSAGASSPGATAAACRGWKVVPAPNPGGSAFLFGVAVVPRTHVAWAAGEFATGTFSEAGLLLRWNGTRWRQVPSASPNVLGAVAATSATDAWAVGNDEIVHWNGKSWTQVSTPSADLTGVTATSPRNVWAVGRSGILHWNGKAWNQQPSPNPSGNARLSAVAAISATDAWAVGTTSTSIGGTTLIEHWNGKAWKLVHSPNPPGTSADNNDQNVLTGVAAISARSAWSVGVVNQYVGDEQVNTDPIIEHWNGKRWRLAASPDPFPGATKLNGVTAISATDAWAVGTDEIVHWNGRAWTRVSTPSVTGGGDLTAVAASPTRRFVWAVGASGLSAHALTLYHC